MNSVKGTSKGSYNFVFGDDRIEMFTQSIKVGSLMNSTKWTFKCQDSATFVDSKNKIYAEVMFDPDEKSGIKSLFSWSKQTDSDYVEGIIYTDPDLNYKLIRND